MNAYEVKELVAQAASTDTAYFEFLRVPDLSAGLYRLPEGGSDLQMPHGEDEVYYVIGGRAQVQVGDQSRAVETGSVIYVPRDVPHRFHSIIEDLTLLVFFAPAEYSRSTQGR